MKADDTINTANTGNPATDGNSQDTPKTPVYRTLGESGLVEDEDGNILSASEIE